MINSLNIGTQPYSFFGHPVGKYYTDWLKIRNNLINNIKEI
uniref:Uncharacterized protein n=1 Tax=Anguilla anguilla TaxID=7936 RepID=A0A0E9TW18_ANGAN